VNYFIGLAYRALGNRSKANVAFKKSTSFTSRRLNVMNYYQALSYAKSGEGQKANEIFEAMIAESDKELHTDASAEVGVIFGGTESENDRLSRLYTIRGLGYKGLGDGQKAKADLTKAMELSRGNLWARVEY